MTLKGGENPSPYGYKDVLPISPTSSSLLQSSTLTPLQENYSLWTTLQEEIPAFTSTQTTIPNYPQPWFQEQQSLSSSSSQSFTSVPAPLVLDKQLPALPPKIQFETPKHRLSATSFGPVDPFHFTSELEPNGPYNVDSDPEDYNPAESVAEMMDNAPLDASHTVSSVPRTELPAGPPNVQSAWLNSTTAIELPPWSQARPPWSELPGCSIPSKPSSTGNTSTDQAFPQEKAQQYLYNNSSQYTYPVRPQSNAVKHRASSYTMTRSELPETGTSSPPRTKTMNSLTSPYTSLASKTAPQFPSPQFEYKPYRVPQPIPEAQVQNQPTPIYRYQSPNQYPYQNYQTLSEAPTSPTVSAASTLPPYPTDFRDQRSGYSTPISPEVPPVLPDPGGQKSQSPERTLTLAEARRRNQKVLLDIMSRESFR